MHLARLVIFGLPLAALGLAAWGAKQSRASRMGREAEVVAMLPGPPPPLNPFVPAGELDRQITDLVHEPLIRIGPDGKLKPALAERWSWSQTVTCWFVKEEQAVKAAAHLKDLDASRWVDWGLETATAKSTELVLRFSSMNPKGPREALGEIATFEPLPAEIIRIDLKELAKPYHDHFMLNAIEAGQVKKVWFDGDTSYELVVAGNAPKFSEEITNYYQAKTNLDPRITTLDHIAALQEPVLEILLHQEKKWHDGSPVTAADVTATFHTVMRKRWPAANREALKLVLSIETLGKYRLLISHRRRSGPAICGWIGLPILPAAWLKANEPDADGRAFSERTPPGAGIFRITHRNLSSLALAPVESAWADFHVRRLSFISGASPFKTRLGFATGAVDMFWPGNDEIAALLKSQGLAIRGMPPRSRLLVLWNTRSPVLADVRVRQALALATDRQALIDSLLHGRGRVEDGLFQPGLWFAQKLPPAACDPDAGCRLLTEAGWLRDVNGIAKRPGQPLAFELLIAEGNADRRRLADMLAAQWRKLGAQAAVTAVSWEEMLDRRLAEGRFDAVIFGLDFETSWDQLPFWHSSQTGGGLNFCGVSDRQIDLLLEDLREEFDPDHVAAKAKALENKVLALHPVLPLFTDMTQVAVQAAALQKGAKLDDPKPWTLRDLVFNHPGASRSKPEVKMLLPSEPAVVPVEKMKPGNP